MANFRPAVAGIPGVAVLPLVKKSRASSEMSLSEISGHSGCCSHAFGEKESSKFRDVSEITPWPKVSTRSLRCHYR